MPNLKTDYPKGLSIKKALSRTNINGLCGFLYHYWLIHYHTFYITQTFYQYANSSKQYQSYRTVKYLMGTKMPYRLLNMTDLCLSLEHESIEVSCIKMPGTF